MPAFKKKSLSLFLRNGCERQFILSLYGKPELAAHSMPEPQQVRAGLGLVAQAGYDWQAEKVNELGDIFGEDNVHIQALGRKNRPTALDLFQTLPLVDAYHFIVEAAYKADTPEFRAAVNIVDLEDFYGDFVDISETHPDIIQFLPPLCEEPSLLSDSELNPYGFEVLPNGKTIALEASDSRLRARIIDVKLTSEPGAHYFAEVVYYSMTLAAWLKHNNLDKKFVVVAAPAIWPGSHEASNLARQQAEWQRQAYQPSQLEMAQALENDIENAPVGVFAPRLQRFFCEELPTLLKKPWLDLAWHVDFRCKGCEFLGAPWKDRNGNDTHRPNHCMPTADTQKHLSKVVGLSRGASMKLRGDNVKDVGELALVKPQSPIFDDHQTLRAKRTTFPFRAYALESNLSSIIPDSGGDATMPRWPNLHIYLFFDYDLSSAITASIAFKAFWSEPLDFGSTVARISPPWNQPGAQDRVFMVDQRDLTRERNEFLKFLRHLRTVLSHVENEDLNSQQTGRHSNISTFQIYLWDEAQRKHLVRLVGRHLPHILSDNSLNSLVWLFPPPELLARVEQDTRQTSITLVANVVQNTVAVPVSHHYRLLDVAATFKPTNVTAPSLHPLYQEPMSDLIPAERIHEWWQRVGQWSNTQKLIVETAEKKTSLLRLVVSQLESELRSVLSRHAAPPVVRPQIRSARISPQGRLWLEYTRLNNALDRLELHSICAMPPHEREARLKSARLVRRLSGKEEQDALNSLSLVAGKQFTPSTSMFIYKLRDGSRDVNVSTGDFLYALAPEARPGFLDEHPFPLVKGTQLQQSVYGSSIGDSQITQVSIEAIDRVNGYIALRAGRNNCIRQLEQANVLDLSTDAILDPIYKDYLTNKVDLSVRAIGYPAIAASNPHILQALGLPPNTPIGKANPSPAAEILWQAPLMHNQLSGRDVDRLCQYLADNPVRSAHIKLNASQQEAFEHALKMRLALIWGPPGTGKSRTLRAIVQGAVLDAVLKKCSLRLLITTHTYTALDNVLLEVEGELRKLLPTKPYKIYRAQSKWRAESPDPNVYPDLITLKINRLSPDQSVIDLRNELDNPSTITIVGCPPQQLHNLSTIGIQKPSSKHVMHDWFDLTIIDEASQMDVATSTLVFTKMATHGACVLAGDNLQLPPIQRAEAPEDLEYVVGSLYNYFRHYHGITPNTLDTNYRSNKTIVEFTKLSGYSQNLTSHSPELKLGFVSPSPMLKPNDWPDDLFWTTSWEEFLDPNYSVGSFIYDDIFSSQANDFEACSIATLIWLLRHGGQLANRLLNERDFEGQLFLASSTPYTSNEFWDKAVGVVAPHRAQVSKIVHLLHKLFPKDSFDAIQGAIDTVERFQGQQRDIIIASFGLGDPDIITVEDEFLYNLNRFNVLTSRSRAKLIVFATRSLLDYLSNDADILRESYLLKQYCEVYCVDPRPIQLGYNSNKGFIQRPGILRRR